MITRQSNVFIDPVNCGSSVGYYITTNEYTPKDKPTKYTISANVVLADCQHKIDWGFGGDGDLEKIDAAIGKLQEFRKEYVATVKIVDKLNKE